MRARDRIKAAREHLKASYKAGNIYQDVSKHPVIIEALKIAAGNKFEEKVKIAEKTVTKIE